MPQITKEQDKAFAGFTSFLKDVIEKSSELHIANTKETKETALDNLTSLLFQNFNFQKVLNEEDIKKMLQQLRH